MITRRLLIFAAICPPLVSASGSALAEPVPNEPLAIVHAIYARVTLGKGDGGGGFMLENKAAKAKYFSKALIALWAKADAHTPKGDVGPVDFDPATNSQDPSVKSFSATVEKMDSGAATIAVTLSGEAEPRSHAEDNVLRYDFVRDGGHWKIDDIRGASDAKPWSIRQMLADSLKN